MLRFDGPSQLFERTATQDVAIGGITVQAGQKVAALLGSANRDPDAFPDADTMDVARDPNAHIAFGAGIHFCLGGPLARLEMAQSLPLLAERWPGISLADGAVQRDTFVLRGWDAVPVTV
jgi:cytochrome P450